MKRRDALRRSAASVGTMLLFGQGQAGPGAPVAEIAGAPGPAPTSVEHRLHVLRTEPAAEPVEELDDADLALVALQCMNCGSGLYDGEAFCYSCYEDGPISGGSRGELSELRHDVKTVLRQLLQLRDEMRDARVDPRFWLDLSDIHVFLEMAV